MNLNETKKNMLGIFNFKNPIRKKQVSLIYLNYLKRFNFDKKRIFFSLGYSFLIFLLSPLISTHLITNFQENSNEKNELIVRDASNIDDSFPDSLWESEAKFAKNKGLLERTAENIKRCYKISFFADPNNQDNKEIYVDHFKNKSIYSSEIKKELEEKGLPIDETLKLDFDKKSNGAMNIERALKIKKRQLRERHWSDKRGVQSSPIVPVWGLDDNLKYLSISCMKGIKKTGFINFFRGINSVSVLFLFGSLTGAGFIYYIVNELFNKNKENGEDVKLMTFVHSVERGDIFAAKTLLVLTIAAISNIVSFLIPYFIFSTIAKGITSLFSLSHFFVLLWAIVMAPILLFIFNFSIFTYLSSVKNKIISRYVSKAWENFPKLKYLIFFFGLPWLAKLFKREQEYTKLYEFICIINYWFFNPIVYVSLCISVGLPLLIINYRNYKNSDLN